MTLVWVTIVWILVACNISVNASVISVIALIVLAFWNCKQLLSSPSGSKVMALQSRLKFARAWWSLLCSSLLKGIKFYVKFTTTRPKFVVGWGFVVLRFAEGYKVCCWAWICFENLLNVVTTRLTMERKQPLTERYMAARILVKS
jgi:hypothetical protein